MPFHGLYRARLYRQVNGVAGHTSYRTYVDLKACPASCFVTFICIILCLSSGALIPYYFNIVMLSGRNATTCTPSRAHPARCSATKSCPLRQKACFRRIIFSFFPPELQELELLRREMRRFFRNAPLKSGGFYGRKCAFWHPLKKRPNYSAPGVAIDHRHSGCTIVRPQNMFFGV